MRSANLIINNGGGSPEPPPSKIFNIYIKFLGERHGDLPNDPVGWAAVFGIPVYRLGRADHHFWSHENTERGSW